MRQRSLPGGVEMDVDQGEVRALLRRSRSGALATALAGEAGWPYVSLVTLACDLDLSPVLLLSDLSEHSRNLQADPRASLLVEEASRRANPQTGARLTLVGRIGVDAEPRLRRRFLARHPGAAVYADFADFHVYRLAIERLHYVGGFGRAQWLSTALTAGGDALAIAACEEEVLTAVNAEHAAAVTRAAQRLLGLHGDGWQMIGIDPDGCDLRHRGSIARLTFARPAENGAALWRELHDLFDRATATDSPPPGA